MKNMVKIKTKIVKIFLELNKYTYKRKELHRVILAKFVPFYVKVLFVSKKHIKNFGFRGEKDLSSIKFVHVAPSNMLNPKNRYLGSVKDILCKKEIFESKYGEGYRTFFAPKGDRAFFNYLKINRIRFGELNDGVKVYIDMPGSYYRSLKYLRRLLPTSKIVFRAHNAESLHNYDKFKATLNLRWLFRSVLTRYFDRNSLLLVDYVDVISRHDIIKYWEPLAKTDTIRKIRFVPFCYTKNLKNEYFKKYGKPKQYGSPAKIVSFGSVGQKNNPINVIRKNSNLQKALKSQLGVEEVMVTGRNDKELLAKKEFYNYLGYVEDPNMLLAKSDILMDLSSLGYGFKTKYLDAAISGCKMLIDNNYLNRIPLELYPFLIIKLEDNSFYSLSELPRQDLHGHGHVVNKYYLKIAEKQLQSI